MLERCPHCDSNVLFVTDICPTCQADKRASVDAAAKTKRQQESTQRSLATPVKVQPVSPIFAGVLLLVAGLAFLGPDPTNPSPFAIAVFLLGLVAAVLSFTRSYQAAEVCAGIFLASTLLSAGYFFMAASQDRDMDILILVPVWFRGGARFLLAAWGAYNLRARKKT